MSKVVLKAFPYLLSLFSLPHFPLFVHLVRPGFHLYFHCFDRYFTDAFTTSGNGIGGSYIGNIPGRSVRAVVDRIQVSRQRLPAVLAEALAPLSVPTLPIPGNHDDRALLRATFLFLERSCCVVEPVGGRKSDQPIIKDHLGLTPAGGWRLPIPRRPLFGAAETCSTCATGATPLPTAMHSALVSVV